jgi:glycosyltransferase involved in cell wall biosynthesis
MDKPQADSTGSISTTVITMNAEKHIRDCLESVKWCDETVIVDSGSTDGTLNIAREYTDRIFVEKWLGFGPQKQLALERAGSEWVLSLDADEKVPERLREEIKDAIGSGNAANGYFIPRKNLYRGKWLRFGGQYPDYVLRLFRRSRGRFSTDIVHEKVLLDGAPKKLATPIEHHTFEDISSRIDKLNRYSTLSAIQMFDSGRRAGALSPLVHFASFFLKDYVLRLGFLDLAEGLNVALLKSLGAYFKYAKLLEYQKEGTAPVSNRLP